MVGTAAAAATISLPEQLSSRELIMQLLLSIHVRENNMNNSPFSGTVGRFHTPRISKALIQSGLALVYIMQLLFVKQNLTIELSEPNPAIPLK